MPRRAEAETTSLKWIHHIREQQFRKAKGLPMEARSRPIDVEKVAQSLRRLGLKVRVSSKKQPVRPRG